MLNANIPNNFSSGFPHTYTEHTSLFEKGPNCDKSVSMLCVCFFSLLLLHCRITIARLHVYAFQDA